MNPLPDKVRAWLHRAERVGLCEQWSPCGIDCRIIWQIVPPGRGKTRKDTEKQPRVIRVRPFLDRIHRLLSCFAPLMGFHPVNLVNPVEKKMEPNTYRVECGIILPRRQRAPSSSFISPCAPYLRGCFSILQSLNMPGSRRTTMRPSSTSSARTTSVIAGTRISPRGPRTR